MPYENQTVESVSTTPKVNPPAPIENDLQNEINNAAKTTTAEDDKILSEARTRCEDCESSNGYILQEIEENQRFFLGGKQWEPILEDTRKKNEGGPRPVMTYNKCMAYTNRICNDQRMNRPGLNLKSKNDGVDPKDVDIAEGLARDITNSGDSATAYDTGMDMAAFTGLGYYWVKTRYCDDETFDQEIFLDRILDSRKVIFPIHQSTRIDFADCNYCFIIEDIDKEEYKREDEKYIRSDIGDWTSTIATPWVKEKTVRRAYYFRKVKTRDHLCLLEDGQKVFQSELPKDRSGIKIVNKRPCSHTKIEWYLMVMHKILDRGVIPGEFIPIVPVIGKEVVYDGKRFFYPVAHEAKDAQKMLNYTKSSFAEYVALAPKAQWMAAVGQDEGFQHEYKMANQANIVILHYNPVSVDGQALPPPQRVPPQPVNVALIEEMRAADEDLKTIIGLPDVNMGRSKNERSGKAIQANQREGELLNYHFSDNLRKAMMHGWKIICSMIPEIYDTARTIKILGKTMEEQTVKINQDYKDQYGETHKHDLTRLKFDVIADTGPSYSTKREKTADLLMAMIEHLPEIGPSMIDLVAEAIGADSNVVDRCKMLLPDKLQQQPNMNEIPVAVQQLIQKLEQTLQQAHGISVQKDQLIQQLVAAIKDKSQERDLKIKTVLIKAQTELHKAAMDNAHELGMAHENFAIAQAGQPAEDTAPVQSAGSPEQAAPAPQPGV
jgi:hypothetical protein